MIRTFAELEASPAVSAEDVKDTFVHYVQIGANICGRVVVDLLVRVQFTLREYEEMMILTNKITSDQLNRGFRRNAQEYRVVGYYLERRVQRQKDSMHAR